MNLGVILPLEPERPVQGFLLKRLLPRLCFPSGPTVIDRVELAENLNLVICGIPAVAGNDLFSGKRLSRLKHKLDRKFSDEGVLSVLEHPGVQSIYGSNKSRYDQYISEIAVSRIFELVGIVQPGSGASRMEIAVTGGPSYLEYAISKLIYSVRCINILLPVGFEEPEEAEAAFCETGIPVHITDDPEVLKRTQLWIRFPGDHESFDSLPEGYSGRIIDLGDPGQNHEVNPFQIK